MALSLKKVGTFVLPDKTADKNATAIYHYTPGSYNAQKGLLLLQISSLESSNVALHSIQYPEENQTLQYAMNLSPNMSGEWCLFLNTSFETYDTITFTLHLDHLLNSSHT